MSKTNVAAERKDQIVRATVECISQCGYHNFSMQDVAKVAHVSKGIIHYYFLNKDDLMLSVLERVALDIEQLIHADMDSSSDPQRKLEIFIGICLNVVRSTKEYYQVNMDFWTQINQKEEVRVIIAKHYANFRESCAKVIIEGIKKNVFRKVDPLIYSAYIVGVVDGISLQWLFENSAFNYEKIAKEITSLILGGLLIRGEEH
jgi:AcrR family transcriptional regulator